MDPGNRRPPTSASACPARAKRRAAPFTLTGRRTSRWRAHTTSWRPRFKRSSTITSRGSTHARQPTSPPPANPPVCYEPLSRVARNCKKYELAEPLRIVDGAVEVVRGLVAFELAFASGLFCLGKKSGGLSGGQRLEIPRDLEGLLQVGKGFATGDDDTGGQAHGVAETLDGRDRVAFEKDSGTHGLHAENANFIFHEDGQDFLSKTLVVSVHGVERHLDGIEMKLMRGSGFEHVQVHRGVLVTGETNEADLAGFLRFEDDFHAATGCEDALRVGHSNDFVELEKIDVVGLEAAERFIELRGGGLPGLAVDFGHEEGLLAIAVAQRLAHADFTVAVVVVPAVVEEVDAAIERGADDADALLFVGLDTEMPAAEADDRDAFAAAAELAIGNAVFGAGGPEFSASDAGQEGRGQHRAQ